MDNKLPSVSMQDKDLEQPRVTMEKHADQFQPGQTEKRLSLEGKPEVQRLSREDSNAARAHEPQQSSGTGSTKTSITSISPWEKVADSEEEEGEVGEDPIYHCKCCSLRSTALDRGKVKKMISKYRATRSRDEILESKVMTARLFENLVEKYGVNGYMQPGEELDPVAIILRPGESVSTYERCFVRWLSYKKLTLETLQDDPEEERRYRQCYAYMRLNQAKKKSRFQGSKIPRQRSRSPLPAIHLSGDRTPVEVQGHSSKVTDANRSRSCGKRARFEVDEYGRDVKHTRLVSADESVTSPTSALSSAGSNTIAEVLRDTITEDVAMCVEQYQEGFAEEVKGVMEKDSIGSKTTKSDISSPSTTPLSSGYETSNPAYSPVHLTGQVSSKSTRGFAESGVIRHFPEQKASSGVVVVDLAPLDHQPNDSDDKKPHEVPATGTIPIASARVGITWKHLEIIHAAAKIIAQAEQVGADPIKLQLIEKYTRLTNQIVLNETAIKDAMAHVQIVKAADKEEEAKNLAEIEAAVVTVDKVKLLRDAALAAVADHEWGEKEVKLAQLLQESVAVEMPGTESHELLVLIFVELKRQREELLTSRMKLESSISSLNASDDAQILALQQQTTQLSTNLSAISLMERQYQKLTIALLRSDDVVFPSKLTKVFVGHQLIIAAGTSTSDPEQENLDVPVNKMKPQYRSD